MSEHISEELLSLYIDEEVNVEEKDMIEGHISQCMDCQNGLLDLSLLHEQILSEYQLINIPDLIEDHVMGKIQETMNQKSSTFLNRAAIIVVLAFGLMTMGATSPFIHVGLHIINTLYSISKGLIYAIPSILSAIPYMIEAISAAILLLIVLAIIILRYLVNTMAKTVEAGDM